MTLQDKVSCILVQAGLVEHMKPLLQHREGEVRARACNVIGNLCRYNTAFYEAISQAGLIELLIDRCRDFDRSTRKFACFAIGNAGENAYRSLQHHLSYPPAYVSWFSCLLWPGWQSLLPPFLTCFSLHNAGFHSAALYHALRAAVKPLVELLSDDEDKTRANAAGALGNLVRNSPMLCSTLLQSQALEVCASCLTAMTLPCTSAPVART